MVFLSSLECLFRTLPLCWFGLPVLLVANADFFFYFFLLCPSLPAPTAAVSVPSELEAGCISFSLSCLFYLFLNSCTKRLIQVSRYFQDDAVGIKLE